MDITNLSITAIEPGDIISVRGAFDTHDAGGRDARIDFLYVAYSSGSASMLDMALADGSDLVANDIFDQYDEDTFGYVPAELDPKTFQWALHGDLLFLEAAYLACEKALREHCDAALDAADEEAKVAFLRTMRDRILRADAISELVR